MLIVKDKRQSEQIRTVIDFIINDELTYQKWHDIHLVISKENDDEIDFNDELCECCNKKLNRYDFAMVKFRTFNLGRPGAYPTAMNSRRVPVHFICDKCSELIEAIFESDDSFDEK